MKKKSLVAQGISAFFAGRKKSGVIPPVTEEDRKQIEEFLKQNGVTKVPSNYKPKD